MAVPPPATGSGGTAIAVPEHPAVVEQEPLRMTVPRLQLLTSPGCHLCERAHQDLDEVAGEFGLDWEELDALAHPELERRHATEIPVLLIDGEPRDFWHIDKPRLRRILAGLLRGQDPEA